MVYIVLQDPPINKIVTRFDIIFRWIDNFFFPLNFTFVFDATLTGCAETFALFQTIVSENPNVQLANYKVSSKCLIL